MNGATQGEMRGIIPRSIELILEKSQDMIAQGWKYTLEATYLEVRVLVCVRVCILVCEYERVCTV
jgi:hypothetical protein